MPGDRGSRRHSSGSRGCAGSNLPGPQITCPLTTTHRTHPSEVPGTDDGELRAYKLGKKRWSYNQCEIKFQQEGGSQQLEVVECMQYGTSTLSDLEMESGVTYQVRLANGYRIRVNIFIVYDEATEVKVEDGDLMEPQGKTQPVYQWNSLSRHACKKNCEGPVLRSIQRFGRLGKRSGQLPDDAQNGKDKVKEAKYMYLSIDEAGTHVGVRRFRLIAGAYDSHGQNLLGTALSPPIRVLANNDVPTGAAFVPLTIEVRADWDGWSEPVRVHEMMPLLQAEPAGHEKTRSLSSNETEYSGGGSESILQRRREMGPLPGMILNHALGSTDSPTLLTAPMGSFWAHGADTATSDARIAAQLLGPDHSHDLGPFQDLGHMGSLHYANLNSLSHFDAHAFNSLVPDSAIMPRVPRLTAPGGSLEGLMPLEERDSPPSSRSLQTPNHSPDMSAMSTYNHMSPQGTGRSVHSQPHAASERLAMQEQMIMRREAHAQNVDALMGQMHAPRRIKYEDDAALLEEGPRINSWDSNAVLSFPPLSSTPNPFDNQSHFDGAMNWFMPPNNIMGHNPTNSVSASDEHFRQQSLQGSIVSPFHAGNVAFPGAGKRRQEASMATMSAADFNINMNMNLALDDQPFKANDKDLRFNAGEHVES